MQLEHKYGANVYLLDDPYLLSLLATVGSPETGTETLPRLMRSTYTRLMGEMLAGAFPVVHDRVQTRMSATEPRAFYEGPRLCRNTKLVIVSIVRAGVLPAQNCYEVACDVLPPGHVRLDFLNMARITDVDGQVTGVSLQGSKIGGPVKDAVVVIPDPMGATGGTVERVVRLYEALEGGEPKSIVALHMMVTPEAIARLRETCPGTQVYSARLDRGLSPPEVLASVPGTHPDKERGLSDIQYIVPGAGGMGELLTNSWV